MGEETFCDDGTIFKLWHPQGAGDWPPKDASPTACSRSAFESDLRRTSFIRTALNILWDEPTKARCVVRSVDRPSILPTERRRTARRNTLHFVRRALVTCFTIAKFVPNQHWRDEMAELTATIYNSPGDGFPYVAVIFSKDGEVVAEASLNSLDAAEQYIERTVIELELTHRPVIEGQAH